MEKLITLIAGALIILLFIAIMAMILALPTMWLWNWLMPSIFGLPVIGFWKALGINLLSGILFKSSSSNNSK